MRLILASTPYIVLNANDDPFRIVLCEEKFKAENGEYITKNYVVCRQYLMGEFGNGRYYSLWKYNLEEKQEKFLRAYGEWERLNRELFNTFAASNNAGWVSKE